MLVKSALLGCIMSIGAVSTAFAYTKGLLNDNQVNVREASSTSSKVVGKLSAGDYVNILGKDGDWYNVSYDSLNSAYIHSDYIDIVETDAYIISDDIELREDPMAAGPAHCVFLSDQKGFCPPTTTSTVRQGCWTVPYPVAEITVYASSPAFT